MGEHLSIARQPILPVKVNAEGAALDLADNARVCRNTRHTRLCMRMCVRACACVCVCACACVCVCVCRCLSIRKRPIEGFV